MNDQGRLFTRAQLHEALWACPRIVLAKEIGISTNGLTRLCDRMHIPYPPRGYWSKRVGERPPPTPLPELIDGPDEVSVTPRGGTGTRRTRSRLSREDRSLHLLDVAAEIVYSSGLPGLSIREISRRVGKERATVNDTYPMRGSYPAPIEKAVYRKRNDDGTVFE